MVDFEQAAGELSSVDEQGLSKVSSLARTQQTLELRIAELEDEVKETKKSTPLYFRGPTTCCYVGVWHIQVGTS